ncbi:MAG: glycoside hydrolase family 5 protein [Lachnospiraceae bacterium]|nr:glycoside hydrolase family 5 protein [Lachnospiraceae bacterium]
MNDAEGVATENDTTGSGSDVVNQDERTESEFNLLNQEEMTAAMGAGWNLGNQLEASMNGKPSETVWGNPMITKELIAAVKNAGFSSIRIPVSYFSYIGEAPDYTVDAKWLDRIETVVNYCLDEGLYVIINMHGDGYHTMDGGWLFCDSEDQEKIQEKYAAVWEQIAVRFRDYDEHLIFESMNEEFDGNYNNPDLSFYKNINAYNQIFVDTVRQTGGNNAMRYLLIPGWNTDITYTSASYGFVIPDDTYRSDKIPKAQKQIMISVHYYTPWDFCGDENGNVTQWGKDATDAGKAAKSCTEDYMVEQFEKLKTEYTSQGYIVVIGEYGSIDKTVYDSTSNYYRSYFAKTLCENAKETGCVPMYWDNGSNATYGFALFSRRSYKVTQPDILSSIMSVYSPQTP